MSQFRLARISMLLAALGLSAPLLLTSAHAADKPAAEAPKPETVRADMYKLLDPKAMSEWMQAKNYAAVKDAIAKAEAFPDRTAYENYVIQRMKLAVSSATNDDAGTVSALEHVLASGRTTPEETANFKLALAERYYNAQNYAKAIAIIDDYQKTAATPHPAAGAMLERAYYLSKDYAKAIPLLKADIDRTEAAGKTPTAEQLRLLASAAGVLKDQANTQYALERMVKYYPADDAWSNVLSRLMNRPSFDYAHLAPFVFRLAQMAESQLDAPYYVELAEMDLSGGQPTEAKKVVDAGYAAGVLGKGSDAAANKKLRDRANKGAADDAKTIGSTLASANKNPDGIGLAKLGYAYVTMDEFDKGIDLIQKGIAKGGKRVEESKLLLGVAYTKAGRKDDAVKAFESVKGDANMNDLARYWIMYLNRPAAAAPAAAAK
jgi:hypothetical protein